MPCYVVMQVRSLSVEWRQQLLQYVCMEGLR